MQTAGFTPGRDITVIAIRAEEAGAWFPASYPGSNAALGRLPPATLGIRRLDTGRTLEEHMRAQGFDADAVRAGRGKLGRNNTAAYLELHIEQGPVLDAEGIPLGIVTGIPGSRRLREARVLGEYNHSGATPRRYRADAAIALAELAHRLDDHWAALETRGHQLVCTFCVLATTEAAGFTKIPGEARFQLDIRSVQPASIDAMFAELHRLVPVIEARRGVRFELNEKSRNSEPSLMDADVQAGLARAAESLGIPISLHAIGRRARRCRLRSGRHPRRHAVRAQPERQPQPARGDADGGFRRRLRGGYAMGRRDGGLMRRQGAAALAKRL